MTISPGLVIDGKYSITRMIGEGGMGAVYEGVNVLIRRRVAIKVLLPGLENSGSQAVERFEREAQAAGCIGNDHILEVLDLGTLPSGARYMVMEFLEGESLAQRIKRMGRLTPDQIAPLLRQALVGLDAAHRAGIVHRDLKPDNIFILREKAGRPDFVKLIDFGISKFNALDGDMSMTRTGAVMGTPYYMSPEQAKGAGGVSHQSDLYSMGVIAFEAVTGQVPFDGTSFNDLMFKIVLGEAPRLEQLQPGVDSAFATIVQRAMAKSLEERFKSAEEFISALDSWRPSGRTLSDGTRSPEPLGQTSAQAALAQPPRTNLDWAASQASEPSKKPSKVLLVAAAAAAVVVVGGAGAWLATSVGSDADSSALPAAPADAPEGAAVHAAAPDPTSKHPEPSPAKAEPAEPPPSPAAEPASPSQASEPPTAPPPDAPKTDTSAPRAPSAPSRPPTNARPPTPEPVKPATKGSRDFGY
jgi:serine/threonine-protein kinase